jgi:hypothetical protein
MKTLEKDELYQNLQEFLKNKGVELKEGSYARKIQKSCSLLADAINTSQQGLARAKVEIDKKLGQLRQVIHEKTAPGPAAPPPPKSAARPANTAKPAPQRKSAGKTKAARKSSKRPRPTA